LSQSHWLQVPENLFSRHCMKQSDQGLNQFNPDAGASELLKSVTL
jgi:hypothetical protein